MIWKFCYKIFLFTGSKFSLICLTLNSQFHALLCFGKGISLGSNSLFWGHTKFVKALGGEIVIGKACRFRSTHTSNLIGINRPCIISTQGNSHPIIKIGNNCGFSGTVIGCFKFITIGNNVNCGANSLITDSDWHLDDPRTSPAKPITIGNNVWLGVNVVVMKGVTIGDNSVIGANSLVLGDIPANVIAAGNPCKVLKPIQEEVLAKMKLNGR